MNTIKIFRVSKRTLLLIAAVFWTFAGGMLLFRGIGLARNIKAFHALKIALSVLCGGLFYIFIFARISGGHVSRIFTLRNDNHFILSFFSARSYILMAIMISGGIILRLSGIVPSEYLSILYIIMGIPLIISSLRFWYNGIAYR